MGIEFVILKKPKITFYKLGKGKKGFSNSVISNQNKRSNSLRSLDLRGTTYESCSPNKLTLKKAGDWS